MAYARFAGGLSIAGLPELDATGPPGLAETHLSASREFGADITFIGAVAASCAWITANGDPGVGPRGAHTFWIAIGVIVTLDKVDTGALAVFFVCLAIAVVIEAVFAVFLDGRPNASEGVVAIVTPAVDVDAAVAVFIFWNSVYTESIETGFGHRAGVAVITYIAVQRHRVTVARKTGRRGAWVFVVFTRDVGAR